MCSYYAAYFSAGAGRNRNGYSLPSAALDIRASSNDKGLLIPHLTLTQRNALSSSASPANGLLIF
ncbi:MAG: hypothetical protein ACON47_03915 [Flavobacteriaceae bacterium]